MRPSLRIRMAMKRRLLSIRMTVFVRTLLLRDSPSSSLLSRREVVSLLLTPARSLMVPQQYFLPEETSPKSLVSR
jgi:hypothetical protein